MSERRGHPPEIRQDIAAARRIEWIHIGWTLSIVVVMGLAMGGSQAMQTAWIEDMLGLIPPIAFLVAVRLEARAPTKMFPYGFDRANGLGFLVAAVALAAVGLFLLKDAVTSLAMQERVTIGSVRFLGRDIWLGWFMLAAQFYATIPPLIIGRMQQPLAERLRDELLHTDALMNKANWQTGVAGFVGVAGLGLGYWWADAAAAALISVSVTYDGWKALKIASAELIDGAPRELGEDTLSSEAAALGKALKAQFPGAKKVLLRETGRYIRAEIVGARPGPKFDAKKIVCEGCEAWRIDSISFRP